eukprot:CAMPEP_0183555634 /NCGR_PEP_ID=MMETSP0371-20130417/80022_1 /TAXON_ID=268820 /ORGANISM="Peridinium aciculiferum, Strain PAER-2" /LENGTH=49 /DNA_ID= /DNA_START= /DNA_END= /DNA_ORIENTATION=
MQLEVGDETHGELLHVIGSEATRCQLLFSGPPAAGADTAASNSSAPSTT